MQSARLCALPVALSVLAGFASSASAQQFAITNLGGLTGFPNTNPSSINNQGQVAGTADASDFSVYHPFRTASNSPINPLTDDLGLLPGVGATVGTAASINDLGQVVGTAGIPVSGSPGLFYGLAFRADPGNPTLVNLGTRNVVFLGTNVSNANGINNSGQVTGSVSTAENFSACEHEVETQGQAFVTTADGLIAGSAELGTVQTGSCGFSNGNAVNNLGQVAGSSNLAGFFGLPVHATFSPLVGPMQDLGTLGGYSVNSYAFSMNDAGQVVGMSQISYQGPSNAFLVTPGSIMQDLGTLGGSSSAALGINKAGQIVGSSATPDNAALHAVLYQNGSIYDLNNLVPAGSGWVLENATAINDFGQIVGTGTLNGVYSAFRLDPVLGSPTLPPDGNNCNGTYQGMFNQDITVSSGQTCYFLTGSNIHGNVTVKKGGNLFLRLVKLWAKMALQGGNVTLQQSTVDGPVDIQGGSATFIDSTLAGNVDVSGGTILIPSDPSTIQGNLTIANLAASSVVSQICGANVNGNLLVSGNASAVIIGQGGACTGNTVLGNVQVENNAAAMTVIGNAISGNLQCSGNASITGSGNTVSGHKQGQCAAF